MRATKMTSSHCRSVTPPLSRASSSDLPLPLCVSPDMTRRTLSPDLVNLNRRAISPSLEAYRPLSPDFARRSRSPVRPRSLMESLLVAKMEALSTGRLVRTDSMDSCSSFGSMSSLPSDVCRCDDCLLGIVDFYMPRPEAFRKVRFYFLLSLNVFISYKKTLFYIKKQQFMKLLRNSLRCC